MPGWGLTQAQIESRPWDLPPELLKPHKRITDPIHADISLTRLEVAILDSRPLQRLRRVRQLGTVHLVYPGATHVRFTHVLGALRVAQDLLDKVLSQGVSPRPAQDLFEEWRQTRAADYDRLVAEATVLARLGALLHDLGHIPFGHTVEDDLDILTSHDANMGRYETLWAQLEEDLGEEGFTLPDRLVEQLRPLILSKNTQVTEGIRQEYPFVADIVGNTICADLMDYLRRDHRYIGLPAEFGLRFLDGFYVTPSTHPQKTRAQHMVIRISRGGEPRADIVSELFKYLRFRYELSERALVHHAKLAADVMIGKVFEMWRDALSTDAGEDAAQALMEEQMLLRSDDGLLEYLIDEAGDHPDDGRWRGILRLATQLQQRRLFKPIGSCTDRRLASEIYARFKSPEARRQLEEDAADYAGAEHGWMVAVWVPDPRMRFKPAEVLVEDGTGTTILPLSEWDKGNGSRGQEILQSHVDLWAIRAFADARLTSEQREVVLARLAQGLGINSWDHRQRSLARIAAERVAYEQQLPINRLEELVVAAEALANEQPTFADLVEALVSLTEERGEGPRRESREFELWRASSGISIEHPAMADLVEGASDHQVILDGVRFDVSTRRGVTALNVALFMRELPERSFGPEGRGRLARLVQDSPLELESRALSELATSAPAQRQAGDAEADLTVANARIAMELMVKYYLSMDDESPRLI